jgi:hypothetical protein
VISAARPNGVTSFGRSLTFLIRNDRLKKVNDLLLSGGCDVEFAAHLGESLIDMLLERAEIRTQVHEVLPKGIEACRRGLAELAEIVAESADIAVGGSCEHTSGRSILLAHLYAPGQVAHLVLESGDA